MLDSQSQTQPCPGHAALPPPPHPPPRQLSRDPDRPLESVWTHFLFPGVLELSLMCPVCPHTGSPTSVICLHPHRVLRRCSAAGIQSAGLGMPTWPHLHYRPSLSPAALLLVLFPPKVQMAGKCLREEEILYNFENQEVKHISEAALLGKSQLSWPMTKILILPFSVSFRGP